MEFRTLDLRELAAFEWVIFVLYWIYAGLNTKATIKKESLSSRFFYLCLLIPAFALVYSKDMMVGFLAKHFLKPSKMSMGIGFVVNTAGVLFAIAARSWLGKNWSGSVTIKQDHELIQSGPYSVTRHPIYTGILFAMVGGTILSGEVGGLIGVVLAFCAFQIKTAKEEAFMSMTFPQYEKYKLKTKKLIPYLY